MPREGPYVFVRWSTSIAGMVCCSGRLLKKGHLSRWRCVCHASLRRTEKYASFLMTARALHLAIFEQPVKKDFLTSGSGLIRAAVIAKEKFVACPRGCVNLRAPFGTHRIGSQSMVLKKPIPIACPIAGSVNGISQLRAASFAKTVLHAEMHVKGALNSAFFPEERFPNPHPRVMINQCF